MEMIVLQLEMSTAPVEIVVSHMGMHFGQLEKYTSNRERQTLPLETHISQLGMSTVHAEMVVLHRTKVMCARETAVVRFVTVG
jgi:hypothetical protein